MRRGREGTQQARLPVWAAGALGTSARHTIHHRERSLQPGDVTPLQAAVGYGKMWGVSSCPQERRAAPGPEKALQPPASWGFAGHRWENAGKAWGRQVSFSSHSKSLTGAPGPEPLTKSPSRLALRSRLLVILLLLSHAISRAFALSVPSAPAPFPALHRPHPHCLPCSESTFLSPHLKLPTGSYI